MSQAAIATHAGQLVSAEDPVRAFQNFATIDLLSRGRAEMIVGRGSSIEAFPLFGPDEVIDKILRHHEAPGGLARLSFQINAAPLPQIRMLRAIDPIGARIVPALREQDIA
ncbi:MAG TPA: hypothetical protein VKE96_15125 [Vicinamibacterales bacterium]|nr:hypothetical protein [Vicinamibacterales bacterium]